MKVREILRRKGHEVVTVGPGTSLLAAMRRLVEHDIGSLVVVDDGEVTGIVTERDVLRLGADDPGRLEATSVGDAMTADLIIATPDDDIHYCMEIMTRNRVRHLPIMDGRDLRGIVSIGDVVNNLRKHAEAENRHLKDYIRGAVR